MEPFQFQDEVADLLDLHIVAQGLATGDGAPALANLRSDDAESLRRLLSNLDHSPFPLRTLGEELLQHTRTGISTIMGTTLRVGVSGQTLRDPGLFLPAVAQSDVLRYYSYLLRSPAVHVADVPALLGSMLDDTNFFTMVESAPSQRFSESLRDAATRWWTGYARRILGDGAHVMYQDGPSQTAATSPSRATEAQQDGDVLSSAVDGNAGRASGEHGGVVSGGIASIDLPQDDADEESRGAEDELLPSQRSVQASSIGPSPLTTEEVRAGYESIRTVLTFCISLTAPYRIIRPAYAPQTTCTTRLMLCREPSIIYLGLLMNRTQSSVPLKVEQTLMPVLCAIAHGWGRSPSLRDLLQWQWEQYKKEKAALAQRRRGDGPRQADADSGATAAAMPDLNPFHMTMTVPDELSRVVPQSAYNLSGTSPSTSSSASSSSSPTTREKSLLEAISRGCLTAMSGAVDDADRCLWWARCRLLSLVLLHPPFAQAALLGEAGQFFHSLWDCVDLFADLLTDEEAVDAAVMKSEEEAGDAAATTVEDPVTRKLQERVRERYANLVGTIADLTHFFHSMRESGLEPFATPTAISTLQSVWSILNAHLPFNPRFHRDHFTSYRHFWQHQLLIDFHVTLVASQDPARMGQPMLTQLTRLLQQQPRYYPALIIRTLGSSTRRDITTAALNAGLVSGIVACLRYYMPELPAPPPTDAQPTANESPLHETTAATAPPATAAATGEEEQGEATSGANGRRGEPAQSWHRPHPRRPSALNSPSRADDDGPAAPSSTSAADDEAGHLNRPVRFERTAPRRGGQARHHDVETRTTGHADSANDPVLRGDDDDGDEEEESDSEDAVLELLQSGSTPPSPSSSSSASSASSRASFSPPSQELVMDARPPTASQGDQTEREERNRHAREGDRVLQARVREPRPPAELLEESKKLYEVSPLTACGYTTLLTCLESLRVLVSSSSHASVNPVSLLLTPPTEAAAAASPPTAAAGAAESVEAQPATDTSASGCLADAVDGTTETETDGKVRGSTHELCTLLHALLRQTRYGSLAAAAATLLAAGIHHNVRDMIPALIERGILQTVIDIAHRPGAVDADLDYQLHPIKDIAEAYERAIEERSTVQQLRLPMEWRSSNVLVCQLALPTLIQALTVHRATQEAFIQHPGWVTSVLRCLLAFPEEDDGRAVVHRYANLMPSVYAPAGERVAQQPDAADPRPRPPTRAAEEDEEALQDKDRPGLLHNNTSAPRPVERSAASPSSSPCRYPPLPAPALSEGVSARGGNAPVPSPFTASTMEDYMAFSVKGATRDLLLVLKTLPSLIDVYGDSTSMVVTDLLRVMGYFSVDYHTSMEVSKAPPRLTSWRPAAVATAMVTSFVNLLRLVIAGEYNTTRNIRAMSAARGENPTALLCKVTTSTVVPLFHALLKWFFQFPSSDPLESDVEGVRKLMGSAADYDAYRVPLAVTACRALSVNALAGFFVSVRMGFLVGFVNTTEEFMRRLTELDERGKVRPLRQGHAAILLRLTEAMSALQGTSFVTALRVCGPAGLESYRNSFTEALVDLFIRQPPPGSARTAQQSPSLQHSTTTLFPLSQSQQPEARTGGGGVEGPTPTATTTSASTHSHHTHSSRDTRGVYLPSDGGWLVHSTAAGSSSSSSFVTRRPPSVDDALYCYVMNSTEDDENLLRPRPPPAPAPLTTAVNGDGVTDHGTVLGEGHSTTDAATAAAGTEEEEEREVVSATALASPSQEEGNEEEGGGGGTSTTTAARPAQSEAESLQHSPHASSAAPPLPSRETDADSASAATLFVPSDPVRQLYRTVHRTLFVGYRRGVHSSMRLASSGLDLAYQPWAARDSGLCSQLPVGSLAMIRATDKRMRDVAESLHTPFRVKHDVASVQEWRNLLFARINVTALEEVAERLAIMDFSGCLKRSRIADSSTRDELLSLFQSVVRYFEFVTCRLFLHPSFYTCGDDEGGEGGIAAVTGADGPVNDEGSTSALSAAGDTSTAATSGGSTASPELRQFIMHLLISITFSLLRFTAPLQVRNDSQRHRWVHAAAPLLCFIFDVWPRLEGFPAAPHLLLKALEQLSDGGRDLFTSIHDNGSVATLAFDYHSSQRKWRPGAAPAHSLEFRAASGRDAARLCWGSPGSKSQNSYTIRITDTFVAREIAESDLTVRGLQEEEGADDMKVNYGRRRLAVLRARMMDWVCDLACFRFFTPTELSENGHTLLQHLTSRLLWSCWTSSMMEEGKMRLLTRLLEPVLDRPAEYSQLLEYVSVVLSQNQNVLLREVLATTVVPRAVAQQVLTAAKNPDLEAAAPAGVFTSEALVQLRRKKMRAELYTFLSCFSDLRRGSRGQRWRECAYFGTQHGFCWNGHHCPQLHPIPFLDREDSAGAPVAEVRLKALSAEDRRIIEHVLDMVDAYGYVTPRTTEYQTRQLGEGDEDEHTFGNGYRYVVDQINGKATALLLLGDRLTSASPSSVYPTLPPSADPARDVRVWAVPAPQDATGAFIIDAAPSAPLAAPAAAASARVTGWTGEDRERAMRSAVFGRFRDAPDFGGGGGGGGGSESDRGEEYAMDEDEGHYFLNQIFSIMRTQDTHEATPTRPPPPPSRPSNPGSRSPQTPVQQPAHPHTPLVPLPLPAPASSRGGGGGGGRLPAEVPTSGPTWKYDLHLSSSPPSPATGDTAAMMVQGQRRKQAWVEALVEGTTLLSVEVAQLVLEDLMQWLRDASQDGPNTVEEGTAASPTAQTAMPTVATSATTERELASLPAPPLAALSSVPASSASAGSPPAVGEENVASRGWRSEDLMVRAQGQTLPALALQLLAQFISTYYDDCAKPLRAAVVKDRGFAARLLQYVMQTAALGATVRGPQSVPMSMYDRERNAPGVQDWADPGVLVLRYLLVEDEERGESFVLQKACAVVMDAVARHRAARLTDSGYQALLQHRSSPGSGALPGKDGSTPETEREPSSSFLAEIHPTHSSVSFAVVPDEVSHYVCPLAYFLAQQDQNVRYYPHALASVLAKNCEVVWAREPEQGATMAWAGLWIRPSKAFPPLPPPRAIHSPAANEEAVADKPVTATRKAQLGHSTGEGSPLIPAATTPWQTPLTTGMPAMTPGSASSHRRHGREVVELVLDQLLRSLHSGRVSRGQAITALNSLSEHPLILSWLASPALQVRVPPEYTTLFTLATGATTPHTITATGVKTHAMTTGTPGSSSVGAAKSLTASLREKSGAISAAAARRVSPQRTPTFAPVAIPSSRTPVTTTATTMPSPLTSPPTHAVVPGTVEGMGAPGPCHPLTHPHLQEGEGEGEEESGQGVQLPLAVPGFVVVGLYFSLGARGLPSSYYTALANRSPARFVGELTHCLSRLLHVLEQEKTTEADTAALFPHTRTEREEESRGERPNEPRERPSSAPVADAAAPPPPAPPSSVAATSKEERRRGLHHCVCLILHILRKSVPPVENGATPPRLTEELQRCDVFTLLCRVARLHCCQTERDASTLLMLLRRALTLSRTTARTPTTSGTPHTPADHAHPHRHTTSRSHPRDVHLPSSSVSQQQQQGQGQGQGQQSTMREHAGDSAAAAQPPAVPPVAAGVSTAEAAAVAAAAGHVGSPPTPLELTRHLPAPPSRPPQPPSAAPSEAAGSTLVMMEYPVADEEGEGGRTVQEVGAGSGDGGGGRGGGGIVSEDQPITPREDAFTFGGRGGAGGDYLAVHGVGGPGFSPSHRLRHRLRALLNDASGSDDEDDEVEDEDAEDDSAEYEYDMWFPEDDEEGEENEEDEEESEEDGSEEATEEEEEEEEDGDDAVAAEEQEDDDEEEGGENANEEDEEGEVGARSNIVVGRGDGGGRGAGRPQRHRRGRHRDRENSSDAHPRAHRSEEEEEEDAEGAQGAARGGGARATASEDQGDAVAEETAGGSGEARAEGESARHGDSGSGGSHPSGEEDEEALDAIWESVDEEDSSPEDDEEDEGDSGDPYDFAYADDDDDGGEEGVEMLHRGFNAFISSRAVEIGGNREQDAGHWIHLPNWMQNEQWQERREVNGRSSRRDMPGGASADSATETAVAALTRLFEAMVRAAGPVGESNSASVDTIVPPLRATEVEAPTTPVVPNTEATETTSTPHHSVDEHLSPQSALNVSPLQGQSHAQPLERTPSEQIMPRSRGASVGNDTAEGGTPPLSSDAPPPPPTDTAASTDGQDESHANDAARAEAPAASGEVESDTHEARARRRYRQAIAMASRIAAPVERDLALFLCRALIERYVDEDYLLPSPEEIAAAVGAEGASGGEGDSAGAAVDLMQFHEHLQQLRRESTERDGDMGDTERGGADGGTADGHSPSQVSHEAGGEGEGEGAAAAAAAGAAPPTPLSGPQPWEGSIDPLFLVALPPDMRSEIVFNSMELLRVDRVHERMGGRTRIAPGFLDQMPEDTQRDVLEIEQRWMRVSGRGLEDDLHFADGATAGTARADGTGAGGARNELYEILLSVDPETRRDVLLTCNLDDLQAFPEILAEAQQLRDALRGEEQRRQAGADAIRRVRSRRLGGASRTFLEQDLPDSNPSPTVPTVWLPVFGPGTTTTPVASTVSDTDVVSNLIRNELRHQPPTRRGMLNTFEPPDRMSALARHAATHAPETPEDMLERYVDRSLVTPAIRSAMRYHAHPFYFEAARPRTVEPVPVAVPVAGDTRSVDEASPATAATTAAAATTTTSGRQQQPLLRCGLPADVLVECIRLLHQQNDPASPSYASAFTMGQESNLIETQLVTLLRVACVDIVAAGEVLSNLIDCICACAESCKASPSPLPPPPPPVLSSPPSSTLTRRTATMTMQPGQAVTPSSTVPELSPSSRQSASSAAPPAAVAGTTAQFNTINRRGEPSAASSLSPLQPPPPPGPAQASLPPTSSTDPSLPVDTLARYGSIATLALRVIQSLTSNTRNVSQAFTLLPDGCVSPETMKSVDAPLDAVEAAFVQRNLLGRLMSAAYAFLHLRAFQSHLAELVVSLNKALNLMEGDDNPNSGNDLLADAPDSPTIIHHPRHIHRLRWQNIRHLPSYRNGGFICNICGINPKDDYCFHCDLCSFDTCGECGCVWLTVAEDRQRVRRAAYFNVATPAVVRSVIALVRHTHCAEPVAQALVELISRGLKESARRDTGALSRQATIGVVESTLVQIAHTTTVEIRECRRTFRDAMQSLRASASPAAGSTKGNDDGTSTAVPQLPAVTSLPAAFSSHSASSVAVAATGAARSAPTVNEEPDDVTLNVDTAVELLHRMSLSRTANDLAEYLFLPYAETSRPEPREITLMWHAAEYYLQDVTFIIQHLDVTALLPLPPPVLSLLIGYCQYHLSESRRTRTMSSPGHGSGRFGSGSYATFSGETERFLAETTVESSSLSDRAVLEVAQSVEGNEEQSATAMKVRKKGKDDRQRLPRQVRKFLEANRSTLNMLLHWSPELFNETFAFVKSEPNLVDFQFKLNDFRSRFDVRRSGPSITLHISRANCLVDSFKDLSKVTNFKAPLQVRFRDEEGADAGGLTREWFQILATEMVNESYALFVHSREGLTYQPNPLSDINPSHLEYFRFAGTVVALAVAHNVPIDVHFTRAVYRHIIGVQPTFQDIESVDPELYSNLKWLLQYDDVAALGLFFEVNYKRFDVMQEEELIPGGKEVAVTNANKLQYVRLLCEFHMTKRIEPQLKEFLKGFYVVIPRDEISSFSEQELELVICGLPDVDVEDLRAHTTYEGYTSSSPQIRWFWETVASMTKEDRANLLQFITGASKVPQGGFQNLESNSGQRQWFTISRWESSHEALPQAHTCFNKIDLPEYPTAEVLREKLMLAITFGSMGFTMV